MGYNAEFTENLRRVKEDVEENRVIIKLVQGQDDVCKKCPLKMECSKSGYTRELDKKVIIATDLEYGKVYDAKKLMDMVRKKISWNIMNMICENCAFYYKCKQIFLSKRTRGA